MKRKCEICKEDKGRRICKRSEDKIICSLCCAKMSNMECEGCLYLEETKQYRASKIKKPPEKHFIAEINPEVEKTVDYALDLIEKGNIKKGESIIVDLQNKHPGGNYKIYYGLGVVHAFKEEYDEAIKYFERTVEIFPYFTEAYFNMGVAYQKKFDIGNTVKAFREVVRICNPESYMVKQANGFIERMEQSVRKNKGVDLETYLEAEDRFNQAFACMQRREWGKALDGFKASLAKSKEHAQSYGNMGICYGYLGQKEEALAYFDKALEIDPTYEPAIFNRRITESFKEGETLDNFKFESVEYYKERAVEKKSFMQSLFQKLMERK